MNKILNMVKLKKKIVEISKNNDIDESAEVTRPTTNFIYAVGEVKSDENLKGFNDVEFEFLPFSTMVSAVFCVRAPLTHQKKSDYISSSSTA